tara:strand:+ start:861 stop:1832 length:972 start_codon:yes stop_codon:yes gene_type:complete
MVKHILSDEQIILLEEVLGDFTHSRDELLFHCPFCDHHKNKLSLNLSGRWHCWVCEAAGKTPKYLIWRHGTFEHRKRWAALSSEIDLNEFEEDLFAEKPKIDNKDEHVKLPKEFLSLCNGGLPPSAMKAMQYLRGRGIGRKDILKWKIGFAPFGKYGGRIIFPSFSVNGYINYFAARSYMGSDLPYLNPPASKNIIFNELCVDWDDDITIVEGVFDAVVAENAIPLLGSTITERSKIFQAIVRHQPRVYIGIDPDAEQEKKFNKSKTERLVGLFLQYNIELYKLDVSGYKDIGEMTKDECARRKLNATVINTESYLERAIAKI